MYILGLTAYSHDSSSCLIEDGKVIFQADEERFDRVKHSAAFPINAINACLNFRNLTIEDIDKITFFWQPNKEIIFNVIHLLKYLPKSINLIFSKSGASEYNAIKRIILKKTIAKTIEKKFKSQKKFNIDFVSHHICHASSVFFVSPYEESAILTIDGRGESASTMFAHGKNNQIDIIKEFKIPNSIGHLYASITDYLGFKPFFDEWKVMGMSAYGTDKYVNYFKDLVKIDIYGQYNLNLKYFNFHTHGSKKWLSKKFYKKFGPKKNYTDKYLQRHYDIAYALQKLVENLGVNLANRLYDLTKSPNLCMTGGVILNCLMNSEIIAKTKFKNVFIQPIANDPGAGIGSALYYYYSKLKKHRNYQFHDIYLGTKYSDNEIIDCLNANHLSYIKTDPSFNSVAKLLAKGKIIGWFQGRMESGPRSLGNRSILANPNFPNMKELLNKKIKKREFFRPFAPSVLYEDLHEYFLLPKKVASPHMILSGIVKKNKRNLIPAITHEDYTARIQSVTKEENLLFWKLINEFKKITGISVLLNTSFNENEPIVNTPQQAIDCFLRNEMDFLVLSNYIVKKN